MKHIGSETNIEIDLTSLDEEEKIFYGSAKSKFESDENWIKFLRFVLGSRSPIYKRIHKNHNLYPNAIKDPLVKTLIDMSVELTIGQNFCKYAKRNNLHKGYPHPMLFTNVKDDIEFEDLGPINFSHLEEDEDNDKP